MQKLANGRYKATISVGSGESRRRRSKTFDTLTDAQNWESKMKLIKGSSRIFQTDHILVHVAFDAYIEKYKFQSVEAATYQGYLATSKLLKRVIPNLALSEVSYGTIQKIFDQLKSQGLSKPTLLKHRSNLHACFAMLVQEGMLAHNYVDLVDCRIPRKIILNTKARVLSIKQYQELIEYLSNLKIPEMRWWHALMLLMFTTGFRTQEAQEIRISDIDFENNCVRVNKAYCRISHATKVTKTERSNRVVPIPHKVIIKLMEWHRYHKISNGTDNEAYVILNDAKRVPDSATYNYHFKAVLHDVLGIPLGECISPHGARRTYVSVMLSPDFGGLTLDGIAKIVGDTPAVVGTFYHEIMPETSIRETKQILGKFSQIIK